MSIIDADGLFNGERLRRCSNLARLHFPYLLLASDGFARLEINYARIVGRAYATFNPVPSEAELQEYLQEYAQNFLLFIWQVDGQLWAQWDTRSELLPRYKTKADRRSPIPPEPAYTEWKQRYRADNKVFPKCFGNIAETFLHGVGVGVGVGVGKNTCALPNGKARVCCLPPVEQPPFDTLDEVPAPENGNSKRKNCDQRHTELDAWTDEQFWPMVWRKVGKEAARRSLRSINPDPGLRTRILEAVKRQAPEFLEREERYRPHPATWLNQRRWEDEGGAAVPQAREEYPRL